MQILRTYSFFLTRMHSSRMRTGRSLTVCRGVPPSGGVSFLGGGLRQRQTPPVNRITHTCKNITLATTSLRPVMKHHEKTLPCIRILCLDIVSVNLCENKLAQLKYSGIFHHTRIFSCEVSTKYCRWPRILRQFIFILENRTSMG